MKILFALGLGLVFASSSSMACNMIDNSDFATYVSGLAASAQVCKSSSAVNSVMVSGVVASSKASFEKLYSITCIDGSSFLGKATFDKLSCEFEKSSTSGSELIN